MADSHVMNFYEAARFQYAAARLMVKLSQFRHRGGFVQNITSSSNFDVRLVSQSEGSFNINIEAPEQPEEEDHFVKISIADLIAYVSERIVDKLDETAFSESATPSRGRSGTTAASSSDALEELVQEIITGKRLTAELPVYVQDLVKRRVSETYREQRLADSQSAVARIDFARSQKLISMSAPLIREMATPLRRSADTLEVVSSIDGHRNSVLFLDRKMAQEIEIAKVDNEITPAMCDILQFNKYNGWGKLRMENTIKIISFSIPSDILQSMKQKIIDSMKRELVYLQTYFVRDPAGDVTRLIVVGILPNPPQ